MKKNYFLLVWALLCLTPSWCATIYVTPNGTGNGTSWDNAYGSLVTALQNAVSGDVIWVQQGTYKPSATEDADVSFVFKNGVKVYGGFAGTETALSERADTKGTTTILSGLLSETVRSKIILKVLNANSSLNLIDGFTIRDARHELAYYSHNGAGVKVVSSVIEFKNVHITHNEMLLTNIPVAMNGDSIAGGAGLYSRLSDIKFRNVNIANNSFTLSSPTPSVSGIQGASAGLYVYKGKINFKRGTVDNNILTNTNYGAQGGGAYFAETDSIYLEAIAIKNNRMNISSTGSTGGAGAYFVLNNKVKLVNNIFHGNFANDQQGNAAYFAFTTATVINNTFGNNNTVDASPQPSGVYIYYSNLRFDNTVFLEPIGSTDSGNTAAFNSCIHWYGLELGTPVNSVSGLMDFINPRFGNYMPKSCSQYLNGGNNSYNTVTTDFYGNPRVVGGTIDYGAIELQDHWTDKVYVDANSTNTVQDGTSWETAFNDLHDALNCGCSILGESVHPAEVWVAEGTYRVPYYGAINYFKDRSFELKKNQAVYGGFVNGATTLEERDITWLEHPTILNGLTNGEHVWNVVYAFETDETAVLDGFIIEDGLANGIYNVLMRSGPGILVRAGSATFNNVWVRNNNATDDGGGIFFYDAGCTANNLKVTGNTAGVNGRGGGISYMSTTYQLEPGEAPPVYPHSHFTNLEVSGNTTGMSGGGMFVDWHYNVSLEDFVFKNNTAGFSGGALNISEADVQLVRGVIDQNTATTQRGGGLSDTASINSHRTLEVESVVFSRNSAPEGGTFYLGSVTTSFVNCTFADNEATAGGNFGYFGNGVEIEIKNSIISNPDNGLVDLIKYPAVNGAIADYILDNSIVNDDFSPLFTIGNGVQLNTAPEFANAENGDYHLLACGVGVDEGINSYLALSPEADADGNARIKNSIVDLGAYEFQYIDLVFTEQPEDNTLDPGATATFTVSTQNEDITLQWQVSMDGGTTWTDIANATAATLTVQNVTEAMHNNLYRCVMSDCGGSAASNDAVLVINGVSGVDAAAFEGLALYPNPADSQFTLHYANATTDVALSVYDVNGRVIHSTMLTAAQLAEGAKVSVSGWAAGVYVIQLSGNGEAIYRFIKY